MTLALPSFDAAKSLSHVLDPIGIDEKTPRFF
jgi:hypothetical protein